MSEKPFYTICACAFYLRMELNLYFVIFFSFSHFSGLFFHSFSIPFLFAPLRTFVNIHVVREFIFSIRILKKLKCSFHLPTFTQCLCLTYLISYNINDLLSLSIISYQNLSFSIDIIANRIEKLVIFTEKNFKKLLCIQNDS